MSAYTIDVSRGENRGEVSAQWAMRPDDQRFTNLIDLRAQVKEWAEGSRTIDVNPAEITVEAEDIKALRLTVGDNLYLPNHFAFGQLASVAKCPADYLRELPAPLAALNLNYGLRANADKMLQFYEFEPEHRLRAITSPKYGRIFDYMLIDEIMKIAGDGTGKNPDFVWKVPGTIEWGGQFGIRYNPEVDVTKQNTTLYASDRDIFVFLVDDRNPIEVGKLANGDPDLMFRGFYAWNSEVGNRTFGVAIFYLRGVCQNRNLWGVEGFTETVFAHTQGAPDRFMTEAAPALISYANASPLKLIEGTKAAKAAIVSINQEERLTFLARHRFSEKQALKVIDVATVEEGRPPESVWDHAQAVSALARRADRQEQRIMLEQVAGKMLDKVAA